MDAGHAGTVTTSRRGPRLVACLAVALTILSVSCTSTPPTPAPSVLATPAPSPTTSATPQTSPTATPTSSPTGSAAFPTSVLGMPVMSVADERSLAVAGNLDGRLVAVAGDWSQMELTCPAIPHDYVMNGFCTGISFSDSNATPQPGIGDENVIVPLESTNGNELYSSQTQTVRAPLSLSGMPVTAGPGSARRTGARRASKSSSSTVWLGPTARRSSPVRRTPTSLSPS